MVDNIGAILDEIHHQVQETLDSGDVEALRALVTAIHPADLAHSVTRLNPDEQYQIIQLLPSEHASDLLEELGTETLRRLLARLPAQQVGDLLDRMAMDDVARILTGLPDQQSDLLAVMRGEDAAEVANLLTYPPSTAGRLMTQKFVRVRPEMTIDETFAYLRQVDPEVETITDLYVVDDEQVLIGVLSLRELVNASRGSAGETTLRDIMTTHIITVHPQTDQEEVARLVAHYNFLAMPVVDNAGHILGIITVDDIIDVLIQENTEDALRFAGVEGASIDQPYFTVPIMKVIRTRISWLLLLFLAQSLTGNVLRGFQSELERVVALTFFIPLLIGMGGNTGAQTVSTIIRGIALKEVRPGDVWRVLLRELLGGLLLGCILGLVAFAWVKLWGYPNDLSLVVGLTIVVICTWSNTISSVIPLLALRLKVDPALISAPLITTVVDATGLAIYLVIAGILLGLW